MRYSNLSGLAAIVFFVIIASNFSTTNAAPPIYPESAELASEVPIADLHLHPRTRLSPNDIKNLMDRTGVQWAGGGATSKNALKAAKGKDTQPKSERSLWLSYLDELGDRFIPFAGQSELIIAYTSDGADSVESVDSPYIQTLIRETEDDLKAGRIKGIGELFINNMRSTRLDSFKRKLRADAPAVIQMLNLVAEYDGFLTLHMDSDDDSVAQLVTLLEANRDGRVLWNHCGMYAEPSQIRSLLRSNDNLFCEFAFRYPPVNPERRAHINIFDESGPGEDWLELFEEFPDRIMIGTDAKDEDQYEEAIKIVRQGLLPYLQPETLRDVAYRNAQRLFDLK
jgi:hypothetical protein